MDPTPKKSFLQQAVHLVKTFADMHISYHAAYACYFIVLAVFPLLVLLLSLLRYTGLQVQTLTAALEGFIPQALMDGAKRLILSTYRSTTGALVSVSAFTALWSASRGIHGLLTGLNAIYGVQEDRGYFRTRAVSVLYTFAFLLVLLLTLILHVFGTTLARSVPADGAPILQFLADVINLRFFLLLGVQTALFTAIFMVLPNRKNRFWDSLPGAILAAVGWLIFSNLYSVYVEHFAGYTNVFGSVYAVALSMLWLYCCVTIVFFGGALNHYLTDHKDG